MTDSESLVLDTHVLMWYLEGINLSEEKVKSIETARATGGLYISGITVWEIAMLLSKEKIILSVPLKEWVDKLLSVEGLNIIDLSLSVLMESCNLPNYAHKDPADRIIIASSRESNSYLMTFDQKILDYGRRGYLRTC